MSLSSPQKLQEKVNAYLKHYWSPSERDKIPSKKLLDSIQAGIFSGGKRFRPVLVLQVAEAIGLNPQEALPFAAALEMVHCYSLIHDDLPCMDDDDVRRGQPTNHILFGESTALLAGDSLLTEAFLLLSEAYQSHPEIGLQLIKLLARNSGERGMAGGQALDLDFSTLSESSANYAPGSQQPTDLLHANQQPTHLQSANQRFENQIHVDQLRVGQLLEIHKLKTGALILAAATAPGIIYKLSAEHQAQLKIFGENLGLAFQLTDDLLDFDPQNPELANLATVIGVDQVKLLLSEATQKASDSILFLGEKGAELHQLLIYNKNRCF